MTSFAFTIQQIDFLTQMPENNFMGDQLVNSRLQAEWTNEVIVIDDDILLEELLAELLNYIEDTSGMLVRHAVVLCDECKINDSSFTYVSQFPSLSGAYPPGWVWTRMVTLAK